MTEPDQASSYVVLVLFKVDPEQADAFASAMSGSVAAVRAAKGNRCYDFNRDPSDPGRFMLYEIFDDEAAWEAHHARPELQALLDTIRPMLAEKPQRSVWAGSAPVRRHAG